MKMRVKYDSQITNERLYSLDVNENYFEIKRISNNFVIDTSIS